MVIFHSYVSLPEGNHCRDLRKATRIRIQPNKPWRVRQFSDDV